MGHPARNRRRRAVPATVGALLLLASWCGAVAGGPAGPAGADPTTPPVVPTWVPAGFVDSTQTPAQVDADLADLAAYGITGVLVDLPRLSKKGTLELSATTAAMLPLWVARTAAHDAATGDGLSVTTVLNGRLDRGLDLDDAATRSAIVADAVRVAGYGVAGIQLDLEPYPTTPGFLTLLGQLDTALGALPAPVRLSVVAPADTATWTPAYLAAVSARVDEVDPTFYDSGIRDAAAYEQWVVAGLAYYSASTTPGADIVPVLPSYRTDPWHSPTVENITTATVALGRALAAGDRIDGAGIWWWWGFYYGAGGTYRPAADQAEWQSTTRPLLGD